MSYNLTYPNKLPDALPTTGLSFVVGNANGQCSFPTISVGDQGQYQFLTSDASGNLSLDNINVNTGTGINSIGPGINSDSIVTAIYLPNQLGIITNPVSFEGDIGTLEMTVSAQGIITAFNYTLAGAERIAEKQATKAAKKQAFEERLSQLESLLQELEAAVP